MAGVLAVSQQHGNLSKNAENVEFGDDNALTGSLGSGNNDGNGLGDTDVSGDDPDPHHGDHLAQQHASCRHNNTGSTSVFRDVPVQQPARPQGGTRGIHVLTRYQNPGPDQV